MLSEFHQTLMEKPVLMTQREVGFCFRCDGREQTQLDDVKTLNFTFEFNPVTFQQALAGIILKYSTPL